MLATVRHRIAVSPVVKAASQEKRQAGVKPAAARVVIFDVQNA